jgi:hypothetical protein
MNAGCFTRPDRGEHHSAVDVRGTDSYGCFDLSGIVRPIHEKARQTTRGLSDHFEVQYTGIDRFAREMAAKEDVARIDKAPGAKSGPLQIDAVNGIQ